MSCGGVTRSRADRQQLEERGEIREEKAAFVCNAVVYSCMQVCFGEINIPASLSSDPQPLCVYARACVCARVCVCVCVCALMLQCYLSRLYTISLLFTHVLLRQAWFPVQQTPRESDCDAAGSLFALGWGVFIPHSLTPSERGINVLYLLCFTFCIMLWIVNVHVVGDT